MVIILLTCFRAALMPEGDHENTIDPPGLTVMRIAGGRYRVTGAVSYAIVDVFTGFLLLDRSHSFEPKQCSTAWFGGG